MPKMTPLPLDAHSPEDLPTVADLEAMDPGQLDGWGPEVNLRRARLAGAALREYAALCGSLTGESTATVLLDFLGDLRHLYDALGAGAATNEDFDHEWEEYDLYKNLDASYPRYLEECDRNLYENGAPR